MLFFPTPGEHLHDTGNVGLGQLVVVRDLDALIGRVDEKRPVIRLALFQDHDAGGDARPEEQVRRELYHAVHEVIVNEVFTDFLLRAAPV